MAVTQHFLGWERALCETVPEWLLDDAQPGMLDLRETVIVVPTRQASWRLRAALPLAAHAKDITLLGPEIVTAPALLHPPQAPNVASTLHVLLAWSETLRAASPDTVGAFLGKERPDTIARALPLARRLDALRTELSDGGLAVSDVMERSAAVCEEVARWQAIQLLEQDYLTRLEDWGLQDPIVRQLAYARDDGEAPAYTRVVLAAMPDPPQLLLTLLAGWEQAGSTVDILVAAPHEEAQGFDGWGRPEVKAWNEGRTITIDDRDILLCAGPEDQAGRIAQLVRTGSAQEIEEGVHPDVAIGVPDADVIAPLQRELGAIGLEAFDPRNRPLRDMPLYGLVELLLALRGGSRVEELGALLRHPDVLAAIDEPEQVLCELDELVQNWLPIGFDDLRKHVPAEGVLATVLERIAGWRETLRTKGAAAGLRVVLQDIYGSRMLETDDPRDTVFRESVAQLDGALRELTSVEQAGQSDQDATAAFMLRLQGCSIKPERGGEPLDLEGWLELQWNPASLMFVSGMNEGMVPDSRLGDLFLPDTLRQQLGLRDDRRRMARDAFLLTSLLVPRRQVVLLLGKGSPAGDPYRPSRLLFRCPDEELVARARLLSATPPPMHTATASRQSFLLTPFSLPDREERLDRLLARGISATKFKSYLACPLRFYLTHVLGMQEIDPRSREPDAAAFGSMVHHVLEEMGESDIWSCGDVHILGGWLEARLRDYASATYGDAPWLGVSAAVESAVLRLKVFAERQVAWHAEGWDIIENEASDHRFEIAGIPVTGRIDRIDRHRSNGAIRVLDYKTTDSADSPAAVHLASPGGWDLLDEAFVEVPGKKSPLKRRWVDLQLPIYREMVRAAYGPAVAVGYVLLPASAADAGFKIWDDYTDALHASAVTCAEAVVARICGGRFWPPAPGKVKYDDFEALLFDDAARSVEAPL